MEELLEYRQNMINWLSQVPNLIELAITKFSDFSEPLAPGEWNPHQVIVHIRDVNREVYLPRLNRIIDEEDPVFVNFDADAWIDDHYDPHEPLDSILLDFKAECLSTANWLRTLPADTWNRIGTHPSIGKHTFQWWLERTIVHLNEHLTQLGVSNLNPVVSVE